MSVKDLYQGLYVSQHVLVLDPVERLVPGVY